MTAVVTSAAVPFTSPYDCWYRHFCQNRDGPCTLPWRDAHRLSIAERRIVARSIQQFQLGEWARGRGFMRRASAHSVFAADARFLPALELFIAEEQGHSRMLGQFLDREGIPRLTSHWLDRIFRRLRKLAGLEACATVLVTAEVLAIPFYQALRDATRSPLLRSICMRILCDEAGHLNYQALTLGLIHRTLSRRAQVIRSRLHSVLFQCTAVLLWQQHHKLFRVAGWDAHRFWRESHRLFERLQLRIRQASLYPGGANPSRDLLLD